MKKSKFSEEQIAYAQRQADGGTPVGDVCRQLGVSEAAWYRRSTARDRSALALRMRVRRRKHLCPPCAPVPLPTRTHERWSKDCVHDALFDGRPFRMLTVVNQ